MKTTFRKIEASTYQIAIGDSRRPVRYDIVVDDVAIGFVENHSTESRHQSRHSRFSGSIIGYALSWRGKLYDRSAEKSWTWDTELCSTRTRAVDDLITLWKDQST